MKDAIDAFLNSFKLKNKFNETYLVAYWEQIMGKSIATRTEKIYINNRTLFLKVSSAPLRQELAMAKSKLISLINKELGECIVDEVVFI